MSITWGHLHVYFFIKLRIHKYIDSIILDEYSGVIELYDEFFEQSADVD